MTDLIQSNRSTFSAEIDVLMKQYTEETQGNVREEDVCEQKNMEESIFNYQKVLVEYMRYLNKIPVDKLIQRGVLVYHGLGSGKTRTASNMLQECLTYTLPGSLTEYRRKIIFMMPKNLLVDPWFEELLATCIGDCELQDLLRRELEIQRGIWKEPKLNDVCDRLVDSGYYFVFYNAAGDKGWRYRLDLIPTRSTATLEYHNIDIKDTNPLSDSIIIIDEMHNLTNTITNSFCNKTGEYNQMYELLFTAQNARIIGLSATPIVNRPFEIAILANILRGRLKYYKDVVFAINEDRFNSTFVSADMKSLINKDMLRRRLIGLISYYETYNPNLFANKSEDIIRTMMLPHQRAGYLSKAPAKIVAKQKAKRIFGVIPMFKEDDKDWNFLPRVKASNVVFPSWVFDEEALADMHLMRNGNPITTRAVNSPGQLLWGEVSVADEQKVLSIMDNDQRPLHMNHMLASLSKKLFHIFFRAFKSPGPVVIYTRFGRLFGVKFIELALTQNGYEKFTAQNQQTSIKKYMIWTGNEKNEAHKRVFNLKLNKMGKKIHILLLTDAGKEGINLRNVRQIHIMDPWWNNVKTRQIIGRGIRICSHYDLQPSEFLDIREKVDERTTREKIVNVFHYLNFPGIGKINRGEPKNIAKERLEKTSIDCIVYNRMLKKKKLTDELLELMKSVAIDCDTNKRKNIFPVPCYAQTQYDDFFQVWNTIDVDANVENIKPIKFKITKHSSYNNQYLLIADNDQIYKAIDDNVVLDEHITNEKLINIGVMEGGNMRFYDAYRVDNAIDFVTKAAIVYDILSIPIADHLDIDVSKETIIAYTMIDKQTVNLPDIFRSVIVACPIVDAIEVREELEERVRVLGERNNMSFIQTGIDKMIIDAVELSTFIVFDLNTAQYSMEACAEDIINKLHEVAQYVILEKNQADRFFIDFEILLYNNNETDQLYILDTTNHKTDIAIFFMTKGISIMHNGQNLIQSYSNLLEEGVTTMDEFEYIHDISMEDAMTTPALFEKVCKILHDEYQ